MIKKVGLGRTILYLEEIEFYECCCMAETGRGTKKRKMGERRREAAAKKSTTTTPKWPIIKRKQGLQVSRLKDTDLFTVRFQFHFSHSECCGESSDEKFKFLGKCPYGFMEFSSRDSFLRILLMNYHFVRVTLPFD